MPLMRVKFFTVTFSGSCSFDLQSGRKRRDFPQAFVAKDVSGIGSASRHSDLCGREKNCLAVCEHHRMEPRSLFSVFFFGVFHLLDLLSDAGLHLVDILCDLAIRILLDELIHDRVSGF